MEHLTSVARLERRLSGFRFSSYPLQTASNTARKNKQRFTGGYFFIKIPYITYIYNKVNRILLIQLSILSSK